MDRDAIQERFGILGQSPAIRQVIDRIRMVAPSDITVLIEGESGVGKELIAQAIHGISRRRHRPLVTVNCGAIPEGLIESELFGHEKGAYTGATDRRAGHFEEAHTGTIFLDEIGELPLAAQVRLLRVLESGEFARVGSSKSQKVDVRIVAATNRDLGKEVRAGRFREDLYYRLSTSTIIVPPLRERREDILPIFEHFLHRFGQQYDAPMKRLDDSARQFLQLYSWPGNVRELRNTAEQATVLVRSNPVSAHDLQPLVRGVSANTALIPAAQQDGFTSAAPDLIYRMLIELGLELREVKAIVSNLATKEGIARYSSVPEAPVAYAEPFAREPYYLPLSTAPQPASIITPMPPTIQDRREEVVQYPYNHDEVEVAHIAEVTEGDAVLDLRNKPLPTFQQMEEALVREGLARFRGNRRKTAKALGISERTLYRKIDEFGIPTDEE